VAPRAFVGLVLAAGLVVAAGCSAPLDITKTANLDPGAESTKFYDLKGQAGDQTLYVDVTATDGEVNAYIILAGKIDAFDKAGSAKTKAEAAAGSALNTKSASISAPVPAKTDVRVAVELAGTKKTSITVKMTNKK
jgi:hypothetical protein